MEDGSERIRDRWSLEEIFGPGGVLEQKLPSFEYRPSQLRMAEAVLEAVVGGHALCVEAGTGTGKTLAYLIPALASHKRVIVSTATKNLQDQLFGKDIPFIREHLFADLSVTYMKGRQNYLCLKRLRERPSLLPLGGRDSDLERIAKWAASSDKGDRTELDWIGDDDPIWNALDARSEICVGQKCGDFERCFVTLMRQRAFESDLIVVNHALFFANLALERDEIGKVLPDFGVLILDEAHEIEDIAATHFGARLSNYQFEEFDRDFQRAFSASGKLIELARRLERSAASFFATLPGESGRHSLTFFIDPDGSSRDLRYDLFERYERLTEGLQLLYSELHLVASKPADWEPLVRRLEQLRAALDGVFVLDDPDHVYWFEKRGRGVFLHVTPIDVAQIMRDRLFAKSDTTILTSATLTTNGNFEYLKERLGVPEPEEVMVPGEFDYSRQAVLYIPRAFPEPRSSDYLRCALREIRAILEISQGDAFLLFTSFQQMNRVYEALSRDLPYPLLVQGEMPKNRLLEIFKETPGSVLCATSSFWQGVDVQGPALRAVVIDKLPFQVPTEPVIAARIHRLEQDGKNAFYGYSVPDAVITLKQGLGRLIRSRRDRGILAILDSRLRTRRYGALFLRSLPNCPVTDNMNLLRNFFETGASPAGGRPHHEK